MVTIRDIAQHAGVSPMTVSNVLNERPHVNPLTRARVLESMATLGYRVNVAARNLRKGRTHAIGLAVPELDRPYFGLLAAAVIKHSSRFGLRVMVEETGRSRETELSALALSRVRMYDGLLLSTVGLGDTDLGEFHIDFPVVLLGERAFHSPVDHLAMPNVEGSRAAVEHLLSKGCRRIAAVFGVVGPERDVSSLRHTGYVEALQAAGLTVDPGLVLNIPQLEPAFGRDAIAELLSQRTDFDGLFCVTDYVALGAVRGLVDAGVRVPQDVKVIGFDDVEYSRFSVPSLSTVSPDHDFMARTAVELLVDRIAGETRDPVEILAPFSITERESTAADLQPRS